mmetsp:Transcript_55703/g.113880  ORF Transcript_55703/g.113880 Transcript_55703/m.113880 type:complete len:288 (-) Transcript_55703:54-917(-)
MAGIASPPVMWDIVVPEPYSTMATSFDYKQDQMFLTRFQDVAVAIAGYFFVVRSLKEVMRRRGGKPFEFSTLVTLHNAFLTFLSAVLFVGFAMLLLEKSKKFTVFEMICSPEFHADGRLHTLYYMNYLVKLYEFLDTVILILKNKPVIFLHEYHHAATLFLCWIQMEEHSTCQWIPITINLFVHILMYYYYTLASLKINVWWKKYLTQFQIIQFVVDIAACVYASSHEPIMTEIGLGALNRPYCHGTLKGAAFGIGTIFSYLVLFIIFYISSYAEAKPVKEKGEKKD